MAEEVTITLLHTTDIHGRLLPTRDYDGNSNVGGLLRCATLIKEMRAHDPELLLVDCGDTIQGSAESYLTQGMIMVKAMQWLNYDAWVIGNHEFDWGLQALKNVHDQTQLPLLGANISVSSDETHPLGKLRSYILKEVKGVRIALIGLTTPGIPSWIGGEELGPLEFEDSVETLGRIFPQVRSEDPDIIILLLHQGYRRYKDNHANQVNRIAKNFPELDVIIGGHTHRVVNSIKLNGILYTQAGCFANGLGKVELRYNPTQRLLTKKKANVITIGSDFPMNVDLYEELSEQLDLTEEYLSEPIGFSSLPLNAYVSSFGQSEIQQLLCKAIKEEVHADIVLHGLLSHETLSAGEITVRDVWRIVPYENQIGLLQLNLEELSEILIENASFLDSLYFMGVHGIQYTLCLRAKEQIEVKDLYLPDGSVPSSTDRFSVALNSFVLASAGRRFPVLHEIAQRPTSCLTFIKKDTREAVIQFIQRYSPLKIKKGFHVWIE